MAKKQQSSPNSEPTANQITQGQFQFVVMLDGGNDYVELPAKALPSGSEISVSFWSYAGSLQPKDSSIIEATDSKGGRIFNIHLPWANSEIYFDCGAANQYDRISKNMPPSEYKEKWLHWTFTKNATTGEMKIYLNGDYWHGGTNTTKPIPNAAKITVGCFTNLQKYHHGMISDLRIWNRDRSPEEIKADMSRRLVGNEPGLVGYWPLNEGSGNTAGDLTSNANHGTIQGKASWTQSELQLTPAPQPQKQAPETKSEHKGIESAPKEIESHLLATGLKDYGFWWQEMLKEQKVSEKKQKPFRRGRIWS